jgi:CBS domain-containing protein/uncharacterized protein (DUF2267 family)
MSGIEAFTNRKVLVLGEDTRASEAARAMAEKGVGCVVVAGGDGKITGVITDRDLVTGLLAVRSDVDTKLVELMTTEPVWVDENAAIDEVAALMETNGIRRVPVMRGPRCVGIVTLDDLVSARAIDYGAAARIVRSQILRGQRAAVERRRGAEHKAARRSEAHMQQTLNRFYHVVGAKTGLPQEVVPAVTTVVLGAIVRRLHFTGAAGLIAQLPQLLHDDLLDLPAGPDRTVTPEAILERLMMECRFDRERASQTLAHFFDALREVIDPRELDHVRAQLPVEMQAVMIPARAA